MKIADLRFREVRAASLCRGGATSRHAVQRAADPSAAGSTLGDSTHQDGVTVSIVGARSAAHVPESADAGSVVLSTQALEDIDAARARA
jgi:aryl-alcohol dehydrogenase-like predicted oxidoreductase